MPEIIPNWHPILVHFTVALLSLSVILFVAANFAHGVLREQWLIVARWLLWFGAAITLLTALAGLYAYNTVAHDTPSHEAMTEHRNWAITIVILFPLLAGWAAWSVRAGRKLGKGFVALMVIAGSLLLTTAWHGGEVVYRYGLGVMSMPNVDSHQHSAGGGHDDGEGSTGGDGHAHGHDADEAAGDGHDHAHDAAETDDSTMDFSGMDEGLDEGPTAHSDTGDHAH